MRTISTQSNCIICSSEMSTMFKYRTFNYLRCPQCQHVVTLPYPTQAQIEQHYRSGFKEGNYRTAREYADVYQSAMIRLAGVVEKYLARRGKFIKGLSVLDIGCFTGEFLLAMQRQGADVYGVELQDEAVRIADKQLPGKIIQADILNDNFKLPQSQFDLITLLGIIEHVTDPIGLVEKASNFLKPGGILVIQTPDSSSFVARIMRRFWPCYTPIEHIHLFSRRSLAMLLESFGYKNISFKSHVKILSIAYAYAMLQTFGPEFYKLLRPFYKISPSFIRNSVIPIYIGEIIAVAERDKLDI